MNLLRIFAVHGPIRTIPAGPCRRRYRPSAAGPCQVAGDRHGPRRIYDRGTPPYPYQGSAVGWRSGNALPHPPLHRTMQQQRHGPLQGRPGRPDPRVLCSRRGRCPERPDRRHDGRAGRRCLGFFPSGGRSPAQRDGSVALGSRPKQFRKAGDRERGFQECLCRARRHPGDPGRFPARPDLPGPGPARLGRAQGLPPGRLPAGCAHAAPGTLRSLSEPAAQNLPDGRHQSGHQPITP